MTNEVSMEELIESIGFMARETPGDVIEVRINALVRLVEEIERLTRELDALKRTREQEKDYADTCYENERLRAALESLQTRLAADRGIVLRSELIELCERALSSVGLMTNKDLSERLVALIAEYLGSLDNDNREERFESAREYAESELNDFMEWLRGRAVEPEKQP